MNKQEKVDLLVEFEKNTNIYDIEEAGVKFYPYIRNTIFDKIFNLDQQNNLHTNTIATHLVDEERLFSKLESEIDVVLLSFWRHEKDENGPFDRITKRYKDELIANNIPYAELIIGFRGETMISDKNTYYITDLNILKSNRLDNINLDFPLLNELSDLIDIKITKNDIRAAISKMYFEYNFYKSKFIDLNVKQVATVTSYMRPGIITAANDLGITTVEIEYAAILDYHRGYYFKGNDYSHISKYLLTWNKTYADYSNYASSITKIFVYGKDEKIVEESRDTYLFVSQYGLTESFIEKAIAFKNKFPDKNVVFRYHPNELRVGENELINNKIGVDNGALYEVLKRTIACFGSFSTALFEAKSYGANVYIIDQTDNYYIDTYIKKGIFDVLTNVNEYVAGTQKPFKLWEKGEETIIDKLPFNAPTKSNYEVPNQWLEAYDLVIATMNKKNKLVKAINSKDLILSVICPNITPQMNYTIKYLRTKKNIEFVKSKLEVSKNAKYVLDASDLQRFYLQSLDVLVCYLIKNDADIVVCNSLHDNLIERTNFKTSELDMNIIKQVSSSLYVSRNNGESNDIILLFPNILGVIEHVNHNLKFENDSEINSFIVALGSENLSSIILNNLKGAGFYEKFIMENNKFIIAFNHRKNLLVVQPSLAVQKFNVNKINKYGHYTFTNIFISNSNIDKRISGLFFKINIEDGKVTASRTFFNKVYYKLRRKAKPIVAKIFTLKRVLKQKGIKNSYKFFSLLPLKKDLVIFESYLGNSIACSPKAIYDHLDGYQKYFAVKKIDVDKNYNQVEKSSMKYLYIHARAKYIVNNSRSHKNLKKRPGQIYLQTWHGTPLKRLVRDQVDVKLINMTYDEYVKNFDNDKNKWDYLISQNSFATKRFRSAFDFQKEMLEVGYPRNDELFVDDVKKSDFGIPENKKVVLYTPTFRDHHNHNLRYIHEEIPILDVIRDNPDVVFILRLHYLISNSIDLPDYDNIIDMSSYDNINDLYKISDMLITDYSSTFFDYANLNRPILFYAYDLKEYESEVRGFYLNYREDLPGKIFEVESDLNDIIKDIDQYGIETKEKREKFINEFCYLDDGHASDRLIKAVFK